MITPIKKSFRKKAYSKVGETEEDWKNRDTLR